MTLQQTLFSVPPFSSVLPSVVMLARAAVYVYL